MGLPSAQTQGTEMPGGVEGYVELPRAPRSSCEQGRIGSRILCPQGRLFQDCTNLKLRVLSPCVLRKAERKGWLYVRCDCRLAWVCVFLTLYLRWMWGDAVPLWPGHLKGSPSGALAEGNGQVRPCERALSQLAGRLVLGQPGGPRSVGWRQSRTLERVCQGFGWWLCSINRLITNTGNVV